MNEVKIVVTGQKKTKSIEDGKKDLQDIGKAAEDASKTAAKAMDNLEKSASASFDRLSDKMNKAFDEAEDRAKQAAASTVDRFKSSTDKLSFGDAFDFDSKGFGEKILSGFTKVSMGAASLAQSGAKLAGSMWDGFVGFVDKGLPPQAKAGIVLALTGVASVVGPAAGAAIGGAVVAGFGAGIAGMGILAAAQTYRVQSAFGTMFADLKSQAIQNSQPIEDMLVRMAGRTKTAFENLERFVRPALATITGPLEHLGDSVLKSFERFAPALQPIADAAGKVFDDVAKRLPGVVGELGDEFAELAEEISRNPEALGDFIAFAGEAAEVALDLMGALVRAWEQWKNMADIVTTPLEWVGLKDGADAADDVSGKFTDIAKFSYDAATGTEGLEDAFKDLAAAGDDAAKRGQALLDILDLIAGRAPTYEESVQKSNDTIRDLLETFGDAKNHVNGFGDALINADGTINTTTANGSLLRDALVDLQADFANMAGATKELEMAGLSHEDAVRKVNEQMLSQRQRLIDNAGQMGLTRDQMQKLLDTYGMNPKILETLARLDDAEAKRLMADLVKNRTATIFVNYMTTDSLGAGSNGGVVLGGSNRVMAHGGVSAGGWTTVGELGPERVMLPPGAQVMPNTRSQPLMETQGGGGFGSGGGGTSTLEYRTTGSPVGLERVFCDWLEYAVRTGKLQLVGAS